MVDVWYIAERRSRTDTETKRQANLRLRLWKRGLENKETARWIGERHT
jgi:hypothetical protein